MSNTFHWSHMFIYTCCIYIYFWKQYRFPLSCNLRTFNGKQVLNEKHALYLSPPSSQISLCKPTIGTTETAKVSQQKRLWRVKPQKLPRRETPLFMGEMPSLIALDHPHEPRLAMSCNQGQGVLHLQEWTWVLYFGPCKVTLAQHDEPFHGSLFLTPDGAFRHLALRLDLTRLKSFNGSGWSYLHSPWWANHIIIRQPCPHV